MAYDGRLLRETRSNYISHNFAISKYFLFLKKKNFYVEIAFSVL